MTKNTLIDLNNHLFEQLERLNDESVSPGKLQREIMRSDAMGRIAENIVKNANVMLKAKQAYGDTDSARMADRSQILLGDKKNEVHKETK